MIFPKTERDELWLVNLFYSVLTQLHFKEMAAVIFFSLIYLSYFSRRRYQNEPSEAKPFCESLRERHRPGFCPSYVQHELWCLFY